MRTFSGVSERHEVGIYPRHDSAKGCKKELFKKHRVFTSLCKTKVMIRQ